MIAEADLYKEWVPFMEDSREMIGTGYRKIVYVKIGLPWPFEARDAVRQPSRYGIQIATVLMRLRTSCSAATVTRWTDWQRRAAYSS